MKLSVLALLLAIFYVSSAAPTDRCAHKCCKKPTGREVALGLFINGLLLGNSVAAHADRFSGGASSSSSSVVKASSSALHNPEVQIAYIRRALRDKDVVRRAENFALDKLEEVNQNSRRSLLHTAREGVLRAPTVQTMDGEPFDSSDLRDVVTPKDVRYIARMALEHPVEMIKLMSDQTGILISSEGSRCCSRDTDGGCVCCVGDVGASCCSCCAEYSVFSCKGCRYTAGCTHRWFSNWIWSCMCDGCWAQCNCKCLGLC